LIGNLEVLSAVTIDDLFCCLFLHNLGVLYRLISYTFLTAFTCTLILMTLCLFLYEKNILWLQSTTPFFICIHMIAELYMWCLLKWSNHIIFLNHIAILVINNHNYGLAFCRDFNMLHSNLIWLMILRGHWSICENSWILLKLLQTPSNPPSPQKFKNNSDTY
jgi:hypothetical protein